MNGRSDEAFAKGDHRNSEDRSTAGIGLMLARPRSTLRRLWTPAPSRWPTRGGDWACNFTFAEAKRDCRGGDVVLPQNQATGARIGVYAAITSPPRVDR